MSEHEPLATLPDVLVAVGAKTADMMGLSGEERLDLRADLDREIAAFHAEGKEHPNEKIAKKFPKPA